jgi:L-alanine-DL-glutamate epimerase-like enolase superfamily enzyme
MELEVRHVELRFRAPLRAAYGTLERRELLEVRLRDAGGEGVGEAAPLEPYDGVALDDVRAELEASGGDPARCDLPQAAAALEIALRDLLARREGRPLAATLVEDPADGVEVNATIGASDEDAASAAVRAVEAGFRCLKLKVGAGDDVARVRAIRDAVGPDPALRLDANGAWSVEEAERALHDLAPAGIELCEEPVHGVRALAELRGRLDGAVAIAMDETAAREPGAAASGAADYVCLKVASCGGVEPLIEEARAARAAGSEVYVASTFDGPVGIAAGLHAAAALRPPVACGLATLSLFEGLEGVLPARAGRIAVPRTPGLGVEPVG